ncbi:MAG: CARDB domain-containing protein [Candidatus Thermoplasmatota archaeon]
MQRNVVIAVVLIIIIAYTSFELNGENVGANPFIKGLSISNYYPYKGEEIKITATIENDGNFVAKDILLEFFIDGIIMNSSIIESLSNEKGENITNVSFVFQTNIVEEGNHEVKIGLVYGNVKKNITKTITVKPAGYMTITLEFPRVHKNPQLIAYNDRLFAIWTAKVEPKGDWSPREIYLKEYDGVEWGEAISLTPNATPAIGHGNHGNKVAIYNNSLYVVWISSDVNQKEIGKGYGSDILLKYYDGISWSEKALMVNNEYGDKAHDWDPELLEYDGKLYVAWVADVPTGNETEKNFTEGVRISSSIANVLIRAYDDSGFSEIINVTELKSDINRLSPDLAVFNDKLYIVWQEVNTKTNEYSIFIKSYDSFNWSGELRIASYIYTKEFIELEPKLYVYNNPISGRGELYVIWQTTDEKIKDGEDFDIVLKYYDGYKWSEHIEITPKGDKGNDMDPTLIEYKKKLYAVWTSSDDLTSYGEDFDIVLRVYDGYKWGENIKTISPLNDSPIYNVGDDFSPQLAIYKNDLYCIFRTKDPVTGAPKGSHIIVRLFEKGEKIEEVEKKEKKVEKYSIVHILIFIAIVLFLGIIIVLYGFKK